MTIVNQTCTKRITGTRDDRLWDQLQRDWAATNPQRWKVLACLHLRLHNQWPLETIGLAFGHSRGHILRLINNGLSQLRTRCLDAQALDDNFDEHSPTAELVALAQEELDRRIAICQQELDVWERLRDAARVRESAKQPSAASRELRVIPGSLRDRLACYLADEGPRYLSQIVRDLAVPDRQTRAVLSGCPEFLHLADDQWSVHPFADQARLGSDVEPVAAAEQPADASCVGGPA